MAMLLVYKLNSRTMFFFGRKEDTHSFVDSTGKLARLAPWKTNEDCSVFMLKSSSARQELYEPGMENLLAN
jgi:hypothetical protein